MFCSLRLIHTDKSVKRYKNIPRPTKDEKILALYDTDNKEEMRLILLTQRSHHLVDKDLTIHFQLLAGTSRRSSSTRPTLTAWPTKTSPSGQLINAANFASHFHQSLFAGIAPSRHRSRDKCRSREQVGCFVFSGRKRRERRSRCSPN